MRLREIFDGLLRSWFFRLRWSRSNSTNSMNEALNHTITEGVKLVGVPIFFSDFVGNSVRLGNEAAFDSLSGPGNE